MSWEQKSLKGREGPPFTVHMIIRKHMWSPFTKAATSVSPVPFAAWRKAETHSVVAEKG